MSPAPGSKPPRVTKKKGKRSSKARGPRAATVPAAMADPADTGPSGNTPTPAPGSAGTSRPGKPKPAAPTTDIPERAAMAYMRKVEHLDDEQVRELWRGLNEAQKSELIERAKADESEPQRVRDAKSG